ncbi:hypothetical protein RJ639_017248 [Escallonia herrerae]|uniref:Pectin acetylesterase n=1 Tax=Escallonia herrerae TaxID=1293975 RepID=A0AA88VDC5_9ASTE|nr:hypothetical protein RJ639_017248 [Escallonia herrerae]
MRGLLYVTGVNTNLVLYNRKDYAGGNSSADFFQQVVLSQLTGLSFLIFNLIISVTRLQGSAKNLPPWCTSIMKPSLIENIMAPKRADPCGSWKFCKFNIYKCSPAQAKTWQDFRRAIIRALAALGRSSSRGMFINSCHTHCQTTLDSKCSSEKPPLSTNITALTKR